MTAYVWMVGTAQERLCSSNELQREGAGAEFAPIICALIGEARQTACFLSREKAPHWNFAFR
jgi:hypothetical protein